MIFAPMVGRKRKKQAEEEKQDQAEAKETNERKTDAQLVGFRPVYVWDVSQTDGAELPKLDEVQGNPADQLPRLIEFVKSQNIKFEYSENIAPARGLSYGGLIRLLPNMTPAEEFSTLVHELAHLCGAEIYVASASGRT